MYNTIEITAFVAADAMIKRDRDGIPYSTFHLIVHATRQLEKGSYTNEPALLPCTSKYVCYIPKKDDKVFINGYLDIMAYTDGEGKKAYIHSIGCYEIKKIDLNDRPNFKSIKGKKDD